MRGNITKYIPNYYYSKVVDIIDHESTHHYHHAFEVYYMKSGTCNYFIGNHSYKVVPGDVILIPADIIHRTNYGGVAHTRLLINCSDDYIPDDIAERIPSIGYLYRNSKVTAELDEIFAKVKSGNALSVVEADKFKTALLAFLAEKYADAYVKLDDLMHADENYGKPDHFTPDGVHPNPTGAEFIAKLYVEAISPLIDEILSNK